MPSFVVPPGAPQRIDTFLALHVGGWSRRTAQRAIATGAVRLRGRSVRKGDFAQGGDVVEVDDACCAKQDLQPNDALPVTVIYADDDLVVVDKASGAPSVALRPSDTGTVANFLLARWPGLATVGASPLESGLLHRLDTNTSGLLLAAKTAAAYAELRRQFAAQAITKEYLAVVHGDVRHAGSVTTPIVHDRKHHDRMQLAADGTHGRPANTFYTPERRALKHDGYSLLRVRITTGVMHQIRVHLAAIGHPVVGDRLYGSSLALPGGRHLLHASRLGFTHPRTGKRIEVESPPPPDFDAR